MTPEWWDHRIEWAGQRIRPLARGLVHLGHMGTGFVVAGAPLLVFGAPLWVGILAVVAWTIAVELRDGLIYGFSKDTAWDAYQLLGGGAVALLGGVLADVLFYGWLSLAFLVVWFAVYWVCLPSID